MSLAGLGVAGGREQVCRGEMGGKGAGKYVVRDGREKRSWVVSAPWREVELEVLQKWESPWYKSPAWNYGDDWASTMAQGCVWVCGPDTSRSVLMLVASTITEDNEAVGVCIAATLNWLHSPTATTWWYQCWHGLGRIGPNNMGAGESDLLPLAGAIWESCPHPVQLMHSGVGSDSFPGQSKRIGPSGMRAGEQALMVWSWESCPHL